MDITACLLVPVQHRRKENEACAWAAIGNSKQDFYKSYLVIKENLNIQ